MEPRQKNWVFLACMLIIALSSVVVVFRNVKHRGQYAGQSLSTTNVQEVMAEIKLSNDVLETILKNGRTGDRGEVYARASKIAALLDELAKESPENPTSERIGEWDLKTTKSVQYAERLADLAADPGADWAKLGAVNRVLQQSCVDCHDQFHKD